MSDLIALLDDALGVLGSPAGVGEDVILRRPFGTGSSQRFVSVKCRARVFAVSAEQISAGIPQTELNFIMSPSQIDDAQWPGGQVPQLPPLDVDQRIPRADTDQIVARGRPKTITFVNPSIIGGELVRIEGRMKG